VDKVASFNVSDAARSSTRTLGNIGSMEMHTRIFTFLIITVLTGCAVPQQSRELEQAAPGHAKLYVLRPAFPDVSRNESPTLYINDRKAIPLKFQSYSEFTLKPGTYKLSLKPRQSESAVWTGEWELSVESDHTYFLVIYNEVWYREKEKAWYVGLPMPYVVTEVHNKSPHYELVAERDALPIIPTLKYVRPIASDFVPLRQ